jgi:TPP-dependent trihydroxycyclohexane-1,2-dione (THcHDO) dehydratase
MLIKGDKEFLISSHTFLSKREVRMVDFQVEKKNCVKIEIYPHVLLLILDSKLTLTQLNNPIETHKYSFTLHEIQQKTQAQT